MFFFPFFVVFCLIEILVIIVLIITTILLITCLCYNWCNSINRQIRIETWQRISCYILEPSIGESEIEITTSELKRDDNVNTIPGEVNENISHIVEHLMDKLIKPPDKIMRT